MGVLVRIAGDDDLFSLASLRRAWNEENAGVGVDDDAFESAFAAWWDAERTNRTFFLAELDGEPIGMANVKRYTRMPAAGRPSGGWWGYVGNVFVLPQHRNDGVGTVLMQRLIEWSWSAGMEHLRLAPSPQSTTFYDRLGFAAGSVVELDPPIAQRPYGMQSRSRRRPSSNWSVGMPPKPMTSPVCATLVVSSTV